MLIISIIFVLANFVIKLLELYKLTYKGTLMQI